MSDLTRYQLRLSGPAQELLNNMSRDLDTTPKEVILDALGVFYYAVTAVKEGSQIGSFDPRKEKFTAIITTSLQHLADRTARSNQSAGRQHEV